MWRTTFSRILDRNGSITLNMVLNVHRNRLIREGGYGGGGRGRLYIYIYISLHCHHQNDSCVNMGSDDSHFNVLLIVRVKVTWQCPQTTTSEERGESKRK